MYPYGTTYLFSLILVHEYIELICFTEVFLKLFLLGNLILHIQYISAFQKLNKLFGFEISIIVLKGIFLLINSHSRQLLLFEGYLLPYKKFFAFLIPGSIWVN